MTIANNAVETARIATITDQEFLAKLRQTMANGKAIMAARENYRRAHPIRRVWCWLTFQDLDFERQVAERAFAEVHGEAELAKRLAGSPGK